MNRRHAVLALLASGSATGAKEPPTPARVAVLAGGSPASTGYLIEAFKSGLRELGYVDGKSIVFESRYALGKLEQLPSLAKELAALKPDVFFATYTAGARAAQEATRTIPIVFGTGDPSAIGIVDLARPGGNVTGLSGLNTDVNPKRLELLIASAPKLSRIAYLQYRLTPDATRPLQVAAQTIGVDLLPVQAQSPAEIDGAFSRFRQEGIKAVIVQGDAFFLLQRNQIAALASSGRMLSMYFYREHVEAGGLMSYGENLAKRFRLAATYVDKILRGASPAAIPIEQPTTLEFIVNLKTAKLLGLVVPPSMALRADEVIQ